MHIIMWDHDRDKVIIVTKKQVILKEVYCVYTTTLANIMWLYHIISYTKS